MAENKKSVLLYCDIIHTVKELDDAEAGRLFKHYLNYINDLNPEAPDKLTKIVFEPIKQNLKRDLKKWEKRAETSRLNGLKGGRPKTQETQQVISKPKEPVKVTVNVKDNVKDNVIVKDIIKKTILDRKADFKKSLFPFLEIYSKELLKEFYDYWTESGENDRKFRKEKQKSFDISLRLKNWHKREKTFAPKKEKIDAATILQQRYGIK